MPDSGEARIAKALGLKEPIYRLLSASLKAGHDPCWVSLADPQFAELFPDLFGLDLLCEHMAAEEALERRRAKLTRLLDQAGHSGLSAEVPGVVDEGGLEDLSLALDAVTAEGEEGILEESPRIDFQASLRCNPTVARVLRRRFQADAVLKIEANEGSVSTARVESLVGSGPLCSFNPSDYLLVRMAERRHALRVGFSLPKEVLKEVFVNVVEGWPPQEEEVYWKLFVEFFEAESLPRLVQSARARLKRQAENIAFQSAWSYLGRQVDRGPHQGLVLGMHALNAKEMVLALLDDEGEFLRSVGVRLDGENLVEGVQKFLKKERPTLLAIQGDGTTRRKTKSLVKELSQEIPQMRVVQVPVPVVRTMDRELARKPSESRLHHNERHAVMVARFAQNPRGAAFHTPHVLRAMIPQRSEINLRRLGKFEITFLRVLLASRGVDVNKADRGRLALVPGLNPESVLRERSTAPFRSLADFQDRMGLLLPAWRSACTLLRVQGGDEPLDARPLHPVYYAPLRDALEDSERDWRAISASPAKVGDLAWEKVIRDRGWSHKVISVIRRGISKRRRRIGGWSAGRGTSFLRLEGLEVGVPLRGKVTAITDYGAFVDVGARREGLIHISQIADDFVDDLKSVLNIGQEVVVRVLDVDIETQKLRLTMKSARAVDKPRPSKGKRRREKNSGRMDNRRRPRAGHGDAQRGSQRKEKDPEEIDPTNPFFVFFSSHESVEAPEGDPGDGVSP